MLKSTKSVPSHSSQVSDPPAQRQARFGAVLLTALTLSAVLLLAAACSGETTARIATPAQAPETSADAPEEEPEHTHGLGDDHGHTHEDGTEHTHDDESAEEGDESAEEDEAEEDEAGPDVSGGDAASTTTTTVPVVKGSEQNLGLWRGEVGKEYTFGPAGWVETQSNAKKTDTHQHTTPDGTVEHEHPYVIGPTEHRHENGKIIYTFGIEFGEDELASGPFLEGEVGEWWCYPEGCQQYGGRVPGTEPKTSTLTDLDGNLLYTCPYDWAEANSLTLEEDNQRIREQIKDPEGHGCVAATE